MRQRFSQAVLVLLILAPASGRAESGKLPPKHEKAGLSCYDCHRQDQPKEAAVPEESCMQCHGDYPAMAAYTKDLPLNPHGKRKADHPGPFGCTECHHQHKKPVVKCLECHPDFKLSPK